MSLYSLLLYTSTSKCLYSPCAPVLAQMFHGSTQASFYRTKRPTQHIGNFTLAQSLVVCQFNHLAVFWGKSLKSKMHAAPAVFFRKAITIRYGLQNFCRVVRIGE